MVQLAQIVTTTKQKLDEGLVEGDMRPYLGMSEIGHTCQRYLWLHFHWCFVDTFSHRAKRLFARGHREEPEIVKELARIGIKHYDDQLEAVMGDGHIKGHIDGKCIGVIEAPKTEHLAEFKLLNAKWYNHMVKHGCEKSQPKYYAQCQLYMKSFKLSRTLFLVVGKNDDSIHIERIPYNAGVANFLVAKGEAILEMVRPISPPFAPTWYACKFCNAKDVCRGNVKVHKTCRSCFFHELESQGQWSCKLANGVMIPEDVQRRGCDHYSQIEI